MILQIISILFILGFAAYMWKVGLFSAIVTFICCLFAGGFAITSYQYIAELTGLATSQPKFGVALCLGLSFLIPFAILRFGLDYLLRFEVVLPYYIDRGCAIVVGILSGMIMIAIPIIMLQLMPLGRSVWTYQPYDDNLEEYSTLAPFSPDDFLIGLGNTFTTAGMSAGETTIQTARQQKLDWMIARNTAGHKCTTYANQPKLISYFEVYDPTKNPYIAKDFIEIKKTEQNPPICLRVLMDINAAEDDRWWRLPATQFVLYAKDKRGKIYRHFPQQYAVIRSDRKNKKLGFKVDLLPKKGERPICDIALARPSKASVIIKDQQKDYNGLAVDWIYYVPENQTPFELQFRNDQPVKLPPRDKYKTVIGAPFLSTMLTPKKDQRRRQSLLSKKPDPKPQSEIKSSKPKEQTPPAPPAPNPGQPLNPKTNMDAIRNRAKVVPGAQF